MNHRWATIISLGLAIYAYLVVATQFFDFDRGKYGGMSVSQYLLYQQQLTQPTNIWEVERMGISLSSYCRSLDLTLPANARVYMTDMVGKTNSGKGGYYVFMTYYLFPRDIAVSLDQPARSTVYGYEGRQPVSDAELRTNGFDFVVTFANNNINSRLLNDDQLKRPENPDWFGNYSDALKAFLLPLFTALSGLWLLGILFPSFGVNNKNIPLLEKLACGFGLGLMAVAALTLGIKLCGFHGSGVVFGLTGLSAIIFLWLHRRFFVAGFSGGFRAVLLNPVTLIMILIFALIFRLAAVQPIVEFDAVSSWMLKAKIFFLCTGNEIIQWFSNPRLNHAHLDYPTLVPALHAATFDSLGHVNEFATKYWPAWMLLFLVAALAAINRRTDKNGLSSPAFLLLALVFLPATFKYVLYEGGTMPMVFFTVLGFLQCAAWQVERDPVRLLLGFTLLFGAAMSKFEGMITIAAAGGWMLLLPSARPAWKFSASPWRMLVFCLLSAMPFLWLRVHIPVLHFESNWASYGLHNPGFTLSAAPGIFMIVLCRWFLNPAFASWVGDGTELHWNGNWEGVSSLYNHPTFGLAWVCLLLTIVLWFEFPARRKVVYWMLVVILSIMVAISLVFASIFSMTANFGSVLSYTSEENAGRYLLPLLVAWLATSMTLLYSNLCSRVAPLNAPATEGSNASGSRPLPGLKHRQRRR